MEERIANQDRQNYALRRPDLALHVTLDAMGHDLSDMPFWFKGIKKKKARLPCRIMGATVAGRNFEHVACIITEFSKHVQTIH